MNRFLDWLVFAEPYFVALAALVAAIALTAGCATSDPRAAGQSRDFATAAVSTAAGGYVGAKEGDGKAKNAAFGAAAGFVVGETINFLANTAQRDAYRAGYEKGQSDAVKQQYWIARENQRERVDDGYEEALYEIPIPPVERNGVRREATTRVIRVVTPKEDRP